ncbi:MAG: DUF4386 family protein [Cyclobacteriaceae bacterium]
MSNQKSQALLFLERLGNISLYQMGGLAAWFGAFAYIIGITVLVSWLNPLTHQSLPAEDKLRFLLAHKDLYQAWILLIYVAFGGALVFLVIALHELLCRYRNKWLVVGTAFGLIWAGMVIASGMVATIGLDYSAPIFAIDPEQATILWLSNNAIHEGLGGGIEMVGGMWVVLMSAAALQAGVLPKAMNYLGLVTGSIGLLTVIPSFGWLGAGFGVLQIVWFIWIGTQLLQSESKINLPDMQPMADLVH